MLVPLLWLKDYVDIHGINTKELADRLTMSGSNVDAVHDVGSEIQMVVAGRIIELENHPDADKLLVAKVDSGNGIIQVVAGAKNIKVGDVVPIALPGAILPGGLKIKKSKLRGVESEGMMCSTGELNLDYRNYPGTIEDGIMIIDRECTLGQDIKEVLGIGPVIDFEITSNRPDCLSLIGMARETAAVLNKSLNYPEVSTNENSDNSEDYVKVDVKDWDLCPRYSARIVKNVKVTDSPSWLRDRLISAGVRPINNIVDITNFIMLEYGQPMHAFDLRMLGGNRIIVRRAEKDEIIETLDGQERKLDEDILVIADANKPVAVAGVMGGANSEISNDTVTILLESANFNRTSVRLTSKRLGLRTESSSRFEKGVDVNNTVIALNRAVHLIEQIAAGEIVGGIIDRYESIIEERILSIRTDRINKLLGTDISDNEMIGMLKKLELVTNQGDKGILMIKIPTFRMDIEGEADIAEEVARLFGYENIESTMLRGEVTTGGKNKRQRLADLCKDTLNAQGLFEIATYSFVSPSVFNKIKLPQDSEKRKVVKISNPLGEENSVMRTTLIPSLLEVLSTNYSRKIDTAAVYELNRVYLPESLPLEKLPFEKDVLSMAAYGEHDFYSLKGVVEELIERLGIQHSEIVPYEDSVLHPGRAAGILIGGKNIGIIGEVHPDIVENYEMKVRVYLTEIDFGELIKYSSLDLKYYPLPKYPAVKRDIAILVKERILSSDIYDCIKQEGGKVVEDINLFDMYMGKQIPSGYKSIAYAIVYRSNERTLRDDEVNSIHEKIINKLEQQFKAKLR